MLDDVLLPSPLWSPLLVVVAWPVAAVLAESEILVYFPMEIRVEL